MSVSEERAAFRALLLEVAVQVAKKPAERREELWELVSRTTLEDLIDVVPRLAGVGPAPQLDAMREAFGAEIDRRLTAQTVDAMERLERKAGFVGWVGVALTLVGVLVAAVSLLDQLQLLERWGLQP